MTLKCYRCGAWPCTCKDGQTIVHGDCREVLPLLDDGIVDMVFTSPPYNLGNTTGGGFPSLGHYRQSDGLARRGGGGKWTAASAVGGLAGGYGKHNDDMAHDDYVKWQKSLLLDCWRLLTASGAIYYNHKPRIFGGRLCTPLEYNPDLPVRQIVVWARAGGINFSPAFYVPTHEWILILARDDFRLRSKGASGAGDVWYIPQQSNPLHPAPFPLELPKRAIESTNAAIVLDPFLGSGTTLVACKQLSRRGIGIEIEERYCEIAANRLRQNVLDFGEAS